MAAPIHEIIQTTYQNPHATAGLKLNVMVVSNTSEEDIERNIRNSSAKYHDWLYIKDQHDTPAILIGGGDSINDHIDDIRELQRKGAVVFAMNGSSQWARSHGIPVDYQVIVDAKEETSTLVDSEANEHIFASQCHEKTLEKAHDLTLFHFAVPNMESFFPPERVKQGGYVLLGGGSTVGFAALATAFSQGYRELHIFGYDSSHRAGKSHAYYQPLNRFMPTTEITWAGRKFEVSVAMKAQAQKFVKTAAMLKDSGCDLHVYGDGLLQTIYNTKATDLTEQEKYQLMWQYDSYRENSPGEAQAIGFLSLFNPEGLIIDYGCGTGRAGVIFAKKGHDVMLLDFADNCRDAEAQALPFLQHDLTKPCPVSSKYGYCTDVMEHLPEKDVVTVINNIMNSSERVFFQISTTEDHYGQMCDTHLHLTVKPHSWWKDLFVTNGYTVEWEMEQEYAALFYISNPDRRVI